MRGVHMGGGNRMAVETGFECIHPFQQLLQRQAQYIREGCMVQVGHIAHVVRVGALDDLARHAHNHRVGRDRFNHHCVGTDAAVISNGDCAQHLGARADHHPVADGGMSFAFLEAGPTQGHAVVQSDVRADLGGLADDYAHPMVNEKT